MTGGRWLGPVIVAATGAAMIAWTWRAWPDPVVDFGRELYVPWRLAEGDVLFRDIAWFNGPLSPYWNALWFRVFGAGLMTLACVNLALLALTTAVLSATCAGTSRWMTLVAWAGVATASSRTTRRGKIRMASFYLRSRGAFVRVLSRA